MCEGGGGGVERDLLSIISRKVVTKECKQLQKEKAAW